VWTVAGQPVRVFPEQSAALERAALRNAIEAFFVRLESGPTEYTVVFDDSDPGQEPLLKRAVADGIPAVFEDFLNLVESEPENSVACFNLAVCLDLMGRHRDSLEWYGRAIGLDPKDSYQQTLLDAKERAARWDLKADENLDWL
jgi:tetratricopeptide (TPR) repeat protein